MRAGGERRLGSGLPRHSLCLEGPGCWVLPGTGKGSVSTRDLPHAEEGPCRASSLLRSWAESLGRHLQRQSPSLLILLRIKNLRPVENTEAMRLLWGWTLSPGVPAWVRSLQGALPHASDTLLFCGALSASKTSSSCAEGQADFSTVQRNCSAGLANAKNNELPFSQRIHEPDCPWCSL